MPQTFSRKQFLLTAALLGASLALPASADSFPNRPLKLVVPFSPGGNTDVVARLVGQGLAEALGQPVVVENVPGANGAIGASRVAAAANDGYTLLFGTAGTQAINPSLYRNLSEKSLDDFEYVALVTSIPNVLVVNESKTPVKSVAELVSYARERRAGMSYGSPGMGSTVHLSGELLKSAAKLDLVHAPYKGSAPSVVSLVSGETDFGFLTAVTINAQLKAGNLRALAVAHDSRLPAMPEVPTMDEAITLALTEGPDQRFPSADWQSRRRRPARGRGHRDAARQPVLELPVAAPGQWPERQVPLHRARPHRHGPVGQAG